MAIDAISEVRVSRPAGVTWDFIVDPANDPRWIRALTESRLLTAPPVGPGTRVERRAKMMGRPIRYTTEVVAFEPPRLLDMKTVAGPFPMHVTYDLEPVGEETIVRVRNRGGTGPLFALLSPLIGRVVKGRVDGDLKALKAALESNGAGRTA